MPPEQLADAAVDSVVRLSGAEGRHAVAVRRLGLDEVVSIVDGEGRRVTGRVVGLVGKDTLDVKVSQIEQDPVHPLRICVAQALVKGDRGELAVSQLTEVGVDEIVPWSAEHSIVQWRGERAAKSAQRWADAVAAAAKQSRRARFPVLRQVADTAAVCARAKAATLAVVLHESASVSIADVAVPRSGEILIVVGPEGGISADERERLASAGAIAIRMGPTVLRTSSAGIAAAAVLLSMTGRWSMGTVGG